MAGETANPGGSLTSDLLGTVIEADGGLERWSELDAVSARLTQSGAPWGLKGQQGGRRVRPQQWRDRSNLERRLRRDKRSHRGGE
jgi:hypothetical protein